MEYVPNHVMLTGGMIPTSNRFKYYKKIADAISLGYDASIDLFTLHLPYALWSYEDVSAMSGFLNSSFKRLGYRPFISCITNSVDPQCIIDNSLNEAEVFGKNVTIIILSPMAQPVKLQSAQLIIQLLDKRHSNCQFIQLFKNQHIKDSIDHFIRKLPGLNGDVSGTFNKQPDLIINFGGDFNQSVQGIPFQLLRKTYLKQFGSLNGFFIYSFVRIIEWFDQSEARKYQIVEGK